MTKQFRDTRALVANHLLSAAERTLPDQVEALRALKDDCIGSDLQEELEARIEIEEATAKLFGAINSLKRARHLLVLARTFPAESDAG